MQSFPLTFDRVKNINPQITFSEKFPAEPLISNGFQYYGGTQKVVKINNFLTKMTTTEKQLVTVALTGYPTINESRKINCRTVRKTNRYSCK